MSGGIGAGKSLVGRMLSEYGGVVIESDKLAHEALGEPAVLRTLVEWWGTGILDEQGRVDRAAVGRKVFADEGERRRLEGLLFPRIGALRRELIERLEADGGAAFYVLDAPLLYEAGLDAECDAVIFVDAPEDQRAARVREERGWDVEELRRRERMQKPLDQKRRMADHIVTNNSNPDALRGQVAHLATQILRLAHRDA